ncbi:MAG: helix-turn-helix domain-containing protein [Oscillospiraceae bacterium]|nr:helix-turn-helix domain-containing protein [Oscillospiraceae bacterium]
MRCAEMGIKVTPLVNELGISSGVISRWKSGTLPNGETLLKLASRLDCSVDYLLGRDGQKEKPAPQEGSGLDDKQRMVYERLAKLTPENLEIAIGQLDVLLTLQEKRDKH